MEERATLRIASQHIGNWLVHSIATSGQVEKAIHGMATIVGAKNADVPAVAGWRRSGVAAHALVCWQLSRSTA